MQTNLGNLMINDRVEFDYNGKARVVNVVLIDRSKDYIKGQFGTGHDEVKTFNLSKMTNVKIWGKV